MGTNTARMGFANEKKPRVIVPNVIAEGPMPRNVRGEVSCPQMVGEGAIPLHSPRIPVRGGQITNMYDYDAIVQHLIWREIRIASEKSKFLVLGSRLHRCNCRL